MGNRCLSDKKDIEAVEKKQRPVFEGQYKDKLNDNRNQLAKTRQERLRQYEEKLDNLKKQLNIL